jgi:flagellar biosynthesis chaperone FliJ
MHEKLREKAFDEFLQEESRREGKEVDQLVSYTYNAK